VDQRQSQLSSFQAPLTTPPMPTQLPVLAFAFASMPAVVEKVAVGVKSKEEVSKSL
jgi:hypothetical protein